MRILLLFAGAAAAFAGPCITANKTCTEWVALGSGPARSLVYRTYSLDAPNPAIVRALIMVHGSGRDADNYFRTALAAAFLAGALDDTIVIAPRFASNQSLGRGGCNDALEADEVSWPCGGNSWRSGGPAPANPHLTSFDFADAILHKLARKAVFPNLRAIVVAGHSAGGQFVTRYEMSNKVHDTLGVPVTYVVANPSSYAYPDALRPAPGGNQFHAFSDARNCTTFDRWPYGLEDRAGYTADIPEEQLKKQLAARPATYLLGEIDILPLGGFDSSCPAMAQGPTRRARGEAFGADVNQRYGAKHTVTIVPLCGHNARCMFTSEVALPVIFPKTASGSAR